MKKFLLVLTLLLAACLPYKEAQIPPEATGASSMLIRAQAPEEARTYRPEDPTAAARIFCRLADMKPEDPFAAPDRRASSHLHAFFGNTGVGAESTLESIATTGNSTCDGGTANRTGYWVPAMLYPDEGADGDDPHNINTSYHHLYGHPVWEYDTEGRHDGNLALNVYYKNGYQGVTPADVDQWFPPGLGMIAGNPAADGPGENPHVWWGCAPLANTGPIPPVGYGGSETIPDCGTDGNGEFEPGWMVVMVAEFPQCWDGVHDGSEPGINYREHMEYGLGWPNLGCPSSHPIALPQVTELVHLTVNETNWPSDAWHLSSDMYAYGDVSRPGGYSAHADFSSGWDEAIGERILSWCYRNPPPQDPGNGGWDCHGPLLGPNATTGVLETLDGNSS